MARGPISTETGARVTENVADRGGRRGVCFDAREMVGTRSGEQNRKDRGVQKCLSICELCFLLARGCKGVVGMGLLRGDLDVTATLRPGLFWRHGNGCTSSRGKQRCTRRELSSSRHAGGRLAGCVLELSVISTKFVPD